MPLVTIDDPHDARLNDFRALTDAQLRRSTEAAEGLYIAESAKVIERACAAGHAPRAVMTQRRWVEGIREIIGSRDVPVYLVPDAVAQAVTGFAVHRGALASMERPVLPPVKDVIQNARTIVILDDLIEHTNVGAIFRAAAGLGADAVLVTQRCADPLYRRSVKVSMGTVFQVPWTRTGAWAATADALHAEGFEIAALALADDAVDLHDFAQRRPERLALVMGTEGDGLSSAALSHADHTVMIPMTGGVDSLNVAAAAAVALWAVNPDRSINR